ncbi:MAG: 30S ribosome-binding factor RbfA [Candidatus Sumerlaeota bacterium]|nr:30S ribosome-binding factor RbfA [Candidatus Sumerlaeota bacterium]
MFPERIKRVEQEMARELAGILDREIKDPRVGMVTVSRVHVTKDLRAADVYVSRLGDDAKADQECLQALEHAAGYIRRLVGERMVLKFLPELKFHLDTSVRYAMALEEIFKKIHESEPPREEAEEE